MINELPLTTLCCQTVCVWAEANEANDHHQHLSVVKSVPVALASKVTVVVVKVTTVTTVREYTHQNGRILTSDGVDAAVSNGDQIEEEHPGKGDNQAEEPDEDDHRATHHLAEAIVEGIVDAVEAINGNGNQCVNGGTDGDALKVDRRFAHESAQEVRYGQFGWWKEKKLEVMRKLL